MKISIICQSFSKLPYAVYWDYLVRALKNYLKNSFAIEWTIYFVCFIFPKTEKDLWKIFIALLSRRATAGDMTQLSTSVARLFALRLSWRGRGWRRCKWRCRSCRRWTGKLPPLAQKTGCQICCHRQNCHTWFWKPGTATGIKNFKNDYLCWYHTAPERTAEP